MSTVTEFSLAGEICSLLKDHSKVLRKKALALVACQLGLRCIPVGITFGKLGGEVPEKAPNKEPELESIPAVKRPIRAASISFVKQDPVYCDLISQRQQIVDGLKALGKDAAASAAVSDLRNIELRIKARRNEIKAPVITEPAPLVAKAPEESKPKGKGSA
jgi:hypothetical protein